MKIIHWYFVALFISVFSTVVNLDVALNAAKTTTMEIFAMICAIITGSISIYFIVRIYLYVKKQ